MSASECGRPTSRTREEADFREAAPRCPASGHASGATIAPPGLDPVRHQKLAACPAESAFASIAEAAGGRHGDRKIKLVGKRKQCRRNVQAEGVAGGCACLDSVGGFHQNAIGPETLGKPLTGCPTTPARSASAPAGIQSPFDRSRDAGRPPHGVAELANIKGPCTGRASDCECRDALGLASGRPPLPLPIPD